MSTRAPRRGALQAIAGVSVAVLALAGCSSDEPDNKDADTSTSSSNESSSSDSSDESDSSDASSSEDEKGSGGGAFDKTAAEGVLLSAEEVGSGYTAVPAAQINSALSQVSGPLTDALDSMTVEPAVCEAVMKTSIGQMSDLAENVDQMAMALFTKGTEMVSESIASADLLPPLDLGAQGDACAEMTLNIMGVTAEATMTPIDIDLGDESTAFLTEMTMSMAGQTVNQVSAQATVLQGDSALSVSISGDSADEATLTDVTTKAFEKAEPVLG